MREGQNGRALAGHAGESNIRCPYGTQSGLQVRVLDGQTFGRSDEASFEIAERPPAASRNISARMSRDIPIRHSTVGVVSSRELRFASAIMAHLDTKSAPQGLVGSIQGTE